MSIYRRFISYLAVLLILAASQPAAAQAPLAPNAHVVGTGNAGSCTRTKLFEALDMGGAITFNCGTASVAIHFNTPRAITATASLDGANLITLSGDNFTRLFDVAGGFSLTLSRLTVSNGYAADDGGAIVNEPGATLIIDRATFRDNQTDTAHSGGAILNRGALTISSSIFDHNQAGNGGALFPRFAASSTSITNSLFIRNSTLHPTNGWGGAMLIWDGAPVTVVGSQFISNTARWGGVAYVNRGGAPSSLTLTSSSLANNLADGGSPTVDGGGGAIYNNANLVLLNTTVEDNLTVVPPGFGFTGVRAGGAIWNSSLGFLQMTGGEWRGNRALHGGALYNLGNVTVTAASLADNLAGRGGAIENANNAGNRLVISATTLSGNQVSFTLYPAITTPLGGAIFNTAHLELTNSTLSGNSGSVAIQEDNSVITLTNVTLAANPNGGLGSDQSPNTSQVHLFNTLLSRNGANNCGPIPFNTFTSQNSLSSDNNCNWAGSQNQNGVDPLLSPLGYHGGPNLTHMLAAGSPAENEGANCPAVDQRGVTRPQGAACDIGAVERRPFDAFFALFLPLTRK